MSSPKFPWFFFSVCLLLVPAVQAKGSAYFRATELTQEDPLEADALFVSVIRNSGEAKIRRAAIHQLFYLRLRSGRTAEAFSLISSESMRKKYASELAAQLKISEKNAERLVQRLRSACGKGRDLQKFADFLEENRSGVSTYDFSFRVLKKCRPADAAEILPVPDSEANMDRRTLALALIAIREGKNAESGSESAQSLIVLKSRAADITAKDAALKGQLLVIEARQAVKNSDFALVAENCGQVAAEEALKRYRGQCRFLTAFALIKDGKPAEAYARLAVQKIPPQQIDNRLLRLIAGVSAGKIPRERLRKFMQRASYPECAPVLRELAENTLK